MSQYTHDTKKKIAKQAWLRHPEESKKTEWQGWTNKWRKNLIYAVEIRLIEDQLKDNESEIRSVERAFTQYSSWRGNLKNDADY